MVKYFCDCCKQEITRENQFEHKEITVGGHTVAVSWVDKGLKKTADEDALCKYCVIDEINKLDDRPRAA